MLKNNMRRNFQFRTFWWQALVIIAECIFSSKINSILNDPKTFLKRKYFLTFIFPTLPILFFNTHLSLCLAHTNRVKKAVKSFSLML